MAVVSHQVSTRTARIFAGGSRAWLEHHVRQSENEDQEVSSCYEEAAPCPIPEFCGIMPGFTGQRRDSSPLGDEKRSADGSSDRERSDAEKNPGFRPPEMLALNQGYSGQQQHDGRRSEE